ncbi:MAG TPA: HEAT repeat domain-containing protein [Polyangiaceae bacterium]|nr:HEAT repeat domain-containing protein [Polyangiaceae bacterium]
MLRSSRTLASLVRVLLLSTPALSAVAALSTVGCKDESQPDYWVDKLSEPAWQANAVKRLEQFFDDTFTRTNKDLTAPDMKALADKLVDPLTKLYVSSYDGLDDKTRESVIKLVAAFRDKRGEPALKKAFDEFAKTGKNGEDVKWAARAAGEMKLDTLSDSMLQAFDKLKASSKDGATVYRDLNEAMLKNPSPAWGGLLKTKLQDDITPPTNSKDPSAVETFRNQLFWQTTSAQLLGEIKDESAVEPLLKVMLDPAKADVQATAALALVKIGKPAAARAVKLLTDQDPALAAYCAARVQKANGGKDAPTNKPHIQTAALVLGVLGRPDSLDPMIATLNGTKDSATRAIIAREIAKIPATPASKQAFRAAYEATPLDAQIPPGANALQTLTESAGSFYDPDFVPWLLERAEKTKATGEEKEEKTLLESTATITAIKLMRADQVGLVQGAVTKWGTQIEKDAFKAGGDLVKSCADRVPCYLAQIVKPENQEKTLQSVGIKAGYMIGVYGNDKARSDLIDQLGAIDNAAVRFVAAQTIDYLSPKGSKDAADALDKIIDKNAKTADKDKIAGDAPLKQIMYRIRARAE